MIINAYPWFLTIVLCILITFLNCAHVGPGDYHSGIIDEVDIENYTDTV